MIDRNQISGPGLALCVAFITAGAPASRQMNGARAPLVAGILIGIYFLLAIRVADQWEKIAVLRMAGTLDFADPASST